MKQLDIDQISERIQANKLEMATLQQQFDQMVAAFNQAQTEHNQKVAQGQNRFQQLVGAVAELEHLKRQLEAPENNGEPAPKEVNRLAKK
jgi:TolA-binding protein